MECYVQSMLHYLLSQCPNLPDEELSRITRRLPIEEDKLRIIADRLREEGLQQGLQQGRQEGIERGIKKKSYTNGHVNAIAGHE